MKLTIGWWKARDGSKWHVHWVGNKRCFGHDPEIESSRSWYLNGRMFPNDIESEADLVAPWTEQALRSWVAEDVPAGAIVRNYNRVENSWSLIVDVGRDGITLGNGQFFNWLSTLECLQYSTDKGLTWMPCGVVEDVKRVIDDGGPAFQGKDAGLVGVVKEGCEFNSGMSLRDWFAGQALAGMCANSSIKFGYHRMPEHPADCIGSISKSAYEIADGVLKAREQ